MSLINKKDIKIEYTKGKGPGGQHKNKTSSTVKATHLPTGIHVTIDGRNQHRNKKVALQTLKEKVKEFFEQEKNIKKKNYRDYKIHNTKTIRTYNYKSGLVIDHRTKKSASLKKVLDKGQIDLLK